MTSTRGGHDEQQERTIVLGEGLGVLCDRCLRHTRMDISLKSDGPGWNHQPVFTFYEYGWICLHGRVLCFECAP
jgi:hypothetical protein